MLTPLFPPHLREHCDHQHQLLVEAPRNRGETIGDAAFVSYTTKLWNTLSTDIREASSINGLFLKETYKRISLTSYALLYFFSNVVFPLILCIILLFSGLYFPSYVVHCIFILIFILLLLVLSSRFFNFTSYFSIIVTFYPCFNASSLL